jgi:hypothetical protein
MEPPSRSLLSATCLLHPASAVKVGRPKLKNEKSLGKPELGLFARRKITDGSVLSEVFGLMAADCDTSHTRLSEITKHKDQRGPTGPRLIAGPLRLINHCCPPDCNCEVSVFLF